MRLYTNVVTALAAGIVAAMGLYGSPAQAQLSGAIFTTTVDGDIVNENVHYEAKEDVYLDGGPGPNAPAKAAGLPEGDYFFQVTDPSGKDLLSTDHISCRRVHVNGNGVIDAYLPGMNLEKQSGKWAVVPCSFHATGVDVDHSELGAITVQLFPYDDTPNKGGVYKAWITPVANYAGETDPFESPCVGETGQCNVNGENWEPGNVHGFIPRWSKTDNYKVRRKGPPFVPPVITVDKFHDKNINGNQDEGEENVTGWAVDVTDPTNVMNTVFTPETIVADEGTYTFVEETPAGTQQTVARRDGAVVSIFPTADPTVIVNVLGDSGETHTVLYGNVGAGSVEACKVFDRNGNGEADEGEPGITGWQITLEGTTVAGDVVGPITQFTGEDGCATFAGLLPGNYTVEEIVPTTGGWEPTGPTSEDVVIESMLDGSDIKGTVASAAFTNICKVTVDFSTKGYWHNKNGLQELTDADIAYVNGLDPYDDPTDYFQDGDEPFDGMFENGDPVQPAIGDGEWQGVEISPEGSARAEISQFLVDPNGDGGIREQLAQQLLAFIFNVRNRLGGDGAAILVNGQFVIAGDVIADAIALWQSGSDADRGAMKDLLDAFNNSDSVVTIPETPCAVVYP